MHLVLELSLDLTDSFYSWANFAPLRLPPKNMTHFKSNPKFFHHGQVYVTSLDKIVVFANQFFDSQETKV